MKETGEFVLQPSDHFSTDTPFTIGVFGLLDRNLPGAVRNIVFLAIKKDIGTSYPWFETLA